MNRAIVNLEGDVFESFIGALDMISDSILFGSGFAYVYNMIVHIFSNIDIDISKGKRGSTKTETIQIFSRFALPSLIEEDEELTDGNILFTVELDDKHVEFLQSYDVTLPSRIIGRGTAPTKKEAEVEAYNQAAKTLASHGITKEWAEEAKHVRDFSDPEVVKHLPMALERLKREGFYTMRFVIPRKTTTLKGSIVQLIGYKSDGSTKVLAYTHTSDRKGSHSSAKADLVRRYALYEP